MSRRRPTRGRSKRSTNDISKAVLNTLNSVVEEEELNYAQHRMDMNDMRAELRELRDWKDRTTSDLGRWTAMRSKQVRCACPLSWERGVSMWGVCGGLWLCDVWYSRQQQAPMWCAPLLCAGGAPLLYTVRRYEVFAASRAHTYRTPTSMPVSVSVKVFLPLCLSLSLSVCLSFSLSLFLSLFLSLSLSLSLSLCLSLSPFLISALQHD